jgi:glycosyltransferase involved in cell wall biosynthesis
LNWRRKSSIYAESQLYVATPSSWLMERVEQSILAPGIVDARVIPNGVDLSVFKPGEKEHARAKLGIPPEARVFLFTASGIRQNQFKDYETVRAAVELAAERLGEPEVLLLALGESGEPARIGRAEVRFVPFEPRPEVVATYYQAADLYFHATRADTFPMTVLEALACGTPVVATAVGGVPEQVQSLGEARADAAWRQHSVAEATGILVPPADAEAMALAAVRLLEDERLRVQLGENAARDARRRFDLETQVDAYLAWYRETCRDWAERSRLAGPPGRETVRALPAAR